MSPLTHEGAARAAGSPLAGKRIVVTRPREQATGFVQSLEQAGAEVLLVPMIEIVPPADPEPLRRAAREPDRFDWIIFTSVNGVLRFWEQLRESGLDTRALAGVSLCAIGPATAAAIEFEGARADLIPEDHVAEGVVRALAAEAELAGSRILLPQAEAAREVLSSSLVAAGAEVLSVAAYQTAPARSSVEAFRPKLAAGEVDMLTFTSSSTVENFVQALGTAIGRAEVGVIGPVTAQRARELELPVHVQADPHTTEGLQAAIERYYAGGAT